MDPSEIRDRAGWFASLQGAHRALARSVHPREMAAVKDQSRELLIQLQAFSEGANDAGDGMASTDPKRLAAIDAALAEQTRRLLEVIGRVEVSQLRATLPQLVREHRDEVTGLLDVLLEDDLTQGHNLRTLEYVITMLAAEERGGRRVAIHEPSQVTRRLAARSASEQGTAKEEACLMAERVIEEATLQVLQDGDVGAIRDRVRRYKEELGSGLLHPRTLAAAVSYNVAMWNHTAAEIDSSRAIEALAESLFSERAPSASVQPAEKKARPQEVVGKLKVAPALVVTSEFTSLVEAFRERTQGQASAGHHAATHARALPLEVLRSEDVDLFEEDSPDETTELMRHAIVLGLLMRSRDEVQASMAEIGIDVESLSKSFAKSLSDRMAELARKLFSESHYADAFRLSDVKTHSLSAFLQEPADDDPDSSNSRRARPASNSASGLSIVLHRLASSPMLAAGVLIAILVGVLLAPPILDRSGPSREERLAGISPFLTSGRETQQEDPRRFVGTLSPTWEYVGTAERRLAVEEIGLKLAEQGVPRIVLMNQDGDVLARYTNGEILLLVEHTAPGGTERPSDR